MCPNLQETADLVTFTEEILNGKFNFSCHVKGSSDWKSISVNACSKLEMKIIMINALIVYKGNSNKTKSMSIEMILLLTLTPTSYHF